MIDNFEKDIWSSDRLKFPMIRKANCNFWTTAFKKIVISDKTKINIFVKAIQS